MNIGIQLFNIAHLQLFSGAGHHLHHSDGANVASNRLVQPRLLVSLGRHQQPVDIIAIAIFSENVHHGEELAPLLTRCGIFNILGIFQVTQQQGITQRGALTILFHEVVQQRQQLRAVLAYRPRNVAAVAQHHVVMDLDFRKYLFPENRFMLIDDDQRHQPGVEHFQQIFILQRFRRRFQGNRRS